MEFAITTLIMRGNAYVPGAVALAKSARRFSMARLVCMVTPDVTDREPLLQSWDEVVEVEYIMAESFPPLGGATARRIYNEWISYAPTKWRCLGLDQYDKVLFLDSDMLIISPIDELFTLQAPAAMFDHQMASQHVDPEDPKGSGFTNRYITPGNKEMIHGQSIHGPIIDRLRTTRGQFALGGGLVLIEPNRFAMNAYIDQLQGIIATLPETTLSGIDEITLTLFYHQNGYTWHHVDIGYNVAAYQIYSRYKDRTKILHYIGTTKPWMESYDSAASYGHGELHKIWTTMYDDTYHPVNPELKNRLMNIMESVIGPDSRDVVDKMWPLYQQAFVGQGVNPVANYELLEAYGDRFLKGQYTWVLVGTPGIITADQVSKISDWFQDATRLTQILDFLKLGPYIKVGKNDAKVKSDVLEALIAAVGISHEHVSGNGDHAMRLFVTNLYKTIFEVDPQRYAVLYSNPISRMNELVQSLRLNRSKLVESRPVEARGSVTITLSYDNKHIGTGTASTRGQYMNSAIKEARDAAYNDALDNRRLEALVE